MNGQSTQLSLFLQFFIKEHPSCCDVRIGHDSSYSQGNTDQDIPTDKAQIQQEAFPLIAFHHASALRNDLPRTLVSACVQLIIKDEVGLRVSVVGNQEYCRTSQDDESTEKHHRGIADDLLYLRTISRQSGQI